MNCRPLSLNRGRVTQLERPKSQINVVAGHVAQNPFAEIPPMAPRPRQVVRMIRPRRRWTEPEIPMKALWNRRRLPGTFAVGQALFAPDMTFLYLPNCASLHQLHHAPVIIARMDLSPHLCREFI